MEVEWSLCCCRIFVSWGCCDAQQTKQLPVRSWRRKGHLRTLEKEHKVTNISWEKCFRDAVDLLQISPWSCEVASVTLWEFRTMQSGVKSRLYEAKQLRTV